MQEKGIKYGLKIKSINVFLQPANPDHVKGVWENCARILITKDDELLQPYFGNLLEWLVDLNWPGALIILERLQKTPPNPIFVFSLESRTKQAVACNEHIWLTNLSELLENEPLKEKLSKETIAVLEQHYHIWDES